MAKSDSKQIGDCKYTVTQVSAGVGLEAASRMANVLGPGFSAAPDSGGFDAMTLANVLGKVFSNPALYSQLAWFVENFGKNTQVFTPDGKSRTLSDIYEVHFQGEIASQLDWLRFAFEVNMHSFFALAQKLAVSFWAKQAADTNSPSPNSAVTSGVSGA